VSDLFPKVRERMDDIAVIGAAMVMCSITPAIYLPIPAHSFRASLVSAPGLRTGLARKIKTASLCRDV
jgi:hypothetical protein